MEFIVSGSGPAVLFLHGLPTSGRLWDLVAPRLAKCLTCIVVDLPGAGKSAPFPDSSLDPDRYATALESLRVELSIPSWNIVGHDAGSAIAVHYASRYPQRLERLVLCSPPLFPEHSIPWFFRLLRAPVLGDLVVPLVTGLLLPFGIRASISRYEPGMNSIVQSFCAPYRGWKGSRQFLHVLRWGEPAQVLGATARLLPKIAVPALIVSGLHDGAVPPDMARKAAAAIPRATLHLVDAGHFLPLDCPEELSRVILELMRDSARLSLAVEHDAQIPVQDDSNASTSRTQV